MGQIAVILGEYTNPNEIVNISLTQVGGSSADLIGAAITITDDNSGDILFSSTWNGSTITTEIDVNTNYTVSVGTISGYKNPTSQSYTAQYQSERNVIFNFAALGVYIESVDHVLYTSSSWADTNTANCVVLITNNCQLRIAITGVIDSGQMSKDDQAPVENYLPALAINAALLDFNGKENTEKLIQMNNAYGAVGNNYAPQYAKAFVFPDGETTGGYLPAAGEGNDIFLNITEIMNCITKAKGTNFGNHGYFTSTYYGIENNTRYVYYYMKSGQITSGTNCRLLGPWSDIRVVAKYEI